MVQGAVDQYIDVDKYIDMEVTFAKEEGTEPFTAKCEHDKDKISFVDAMKPISRRNHNKVVFLMGLDKVTTELNLR